MHNSQEVIKVLDDVLPSLAEKKITNHDKRYTLVVAIFDALRKAEISTKNCQSIVDRIIVDLSLFPNRYLIKLVDYFVDRIRRNDDDFMW